MYQNLINERLNAYGKNRYGSLMKVIKYNGNNDIWVQFENGYSTHTNWYDFIRGKVSNPYDKTVYGIGYLGEGKYKTGIIDKNGKYIQKTQYKVWKDMLRRCYDEKSIEKSPTYKECYVCKEWLNFQNFATWYDENYYKINNYRMQIDKDILIKGNKIYSPETCIFVPQNINLLFTKSQRNRGDLPIGVFYYKTRKKYRSHCSDGNGIEITIGQFNTPEEAFFAYKKFKEQLIKQIAEEYKDRIPDKLYNAMINYIIEITD